MMTFINPLVLRSFLWLRVYLHGFYITWVPVIIVDRSVQLFPIGGEEESAIILCFDNSSNTWNLILLYT